LRIDSGEDLVFEEFREESRSRDWRRRLLNMFLSVL